MWILSLAPYHKILFNRPNKPECFITLGWKDLPGSNVLAYWAHWKECFLAMQLLFITLHFLRNLWIEPMSQITLTLHYTWLEIFARDKCSSLLALFVSYEENEVLIIMSHGTIFMTLHFLHTSWIDPNKLECYITL